LFTRARSSARSRSRPSRRVRTPTAPHVHKNAQIELKVTQVTVDGQTYRLGFSPHPDAPPQVNQKDQEYFDDFLFGFTERMKGGKLETNKKFEFGPGKLAARDFVVKGDTGSMKGRLIMRNKQLIVITVAAPMAKYDEKKADAFIESFEFYLPQAPEKNSEPLERPTARRLIRPRALASPARPTRRAAVR
jgi:hypothetical protein